MDTTTVELLHPHYPVGLAGLAPTAILADQQSAAATYEITLALTVPEPGCCVAQATLTNTGAEPLRLQGLRWRFSPAAKGGPALHFPLALEPQVFATENLRGDYFGTGTVEGDRYGYPLTNQTVEYGQSEDHVFPGLFVASATAPVGLFMAQASQLRFHPLFRFRGRMERQDKWLFELEERVSGVTAVEVAPGARLGGERLFFNVVDTNDPQQATAAYYRLLHASGAFARRAANPLPAQRIYCTWNYDFFADVTEEKVLGQIPVLQQHFPSVKFLQVDDGYQTCHAPGQRAMIDLCYGDLPQPFDPVRFPSGPRALAERITAAGLRPAIWLGLWASTGSRMLTDHPDWVLRDDTGTPWLFSQWYGGTAILDPSVPGVRDYLHHLCRTVFQEWGYAGVKLDYSSFAFNGKRARFRYPGRTAIELRHDLERIFRQYLPHDGFFGWCVVAGTAQPFLTQADYFRNAIDIGHGNWALAHRIAMWTANTCMLMPEAPCLPNIDSIGWSKDFDDTSWSTWLAFCAVTGMALEVSGDLRTLPAWRLQRLARTLALSDPNRRVWCPGLAQARGQPPAVWIATGATSSLIGVYNWHETPVRVALDAVPPALFGQPVADAWDGQMHMLPSHLDLGPRESRLWLVTASAAAPVVATP